MFSGYEGSREGKENDRQKLCLHPPIFFHTSCLGHLEEIRRLCAVTAHLLTAIRVLEAP